MNDKPIVGRTPDLIWSDDLFGRAAEAEALLAFLESIADRKDGSGYTLAVNAPYGVGKTYFLTRLAEHLSLNHPVVFVDAWKDDLADEPLTALAATLRLALDPLFSRSRSIEKRWKSVAEQTGKVAMIVAKGLAKKALSVAITAGSADAVEHLLQGASTAHASLARFSHRVV